MLYKLCDWFNAFSLFSILVLQPCVHFARQSCMKGDDCQYDHELSKYPCNNFKENGFCSRGDRCMFSHKVNSCLYKMLIRASYNVKPAWQGLSLHYICLTICPE